MNIGFYTGRVLIICNIIIRISSGGILNISNVPYMVRYELIVAKRLRALRGVPLVECSHYLVLLVSKFFHPEEACFFFIPQRRVP